MDSFDYLWELLAPVGEYVSRKDACRSLWNALSKYKQRQIFWYLREAKKMGKKIDENPYFAINNCNPHPTNWNGREGINKRMKDEKMVIAFYNGSYGMYTLFEAALFQMNDAQAANFDPDDLSGQNALMFNAIRRK